MAPEAVMQTLERLWSVLHASGLRVAVAGGIALSYWGNPRSTQDIDLAVLSDDSDTIAVLLGGNGFKPAAKEPVPLGLFVLSQWSYELEDQFIAVEIDLMCSTSEYYAAALGRAKPVRLASIETQFSVLCREDLILHKVFAERLIDQADVMT